MTLYDLYPVLLLLGTLGLAILWEFRRQVVVRVVTRRLTIAAIVSLAVLMLISLPVRLLAPAPLLPSSRLLSWQLIRVAGWDAATAQTATVVPIEVRHPACAPGEGTSWLASPIVSYTPWSVTITMQMNDTIDSMTCFVPHPGATLPTIGDYLMGLIYQVQLSEPLHGRALLDGSSFPPQGRPQH